MGSRRARASVAARRLAEIGSGGGTRDGDTRAAVTALAAATADGAPLVVREAATALGMIGAGARAAAVDLERLAAHQDGEVVARARAALRVMRRDLERRRPRSPGGRASARAK